MKLNIKNIVVATLMVLVSLPIAATAREKKEKAPFSLPKAGDFSIGIDALPVINFMGNVFNNTDSQILDDLTGAPIDFDSYDGTVSPTASFLGRYMLTNKLAIRVNLGIIVDNETETLYTTDDKAVESDPLSEAEVVDEMKTVKSGASIAAGIEYRIGKGRVQGIFSGNALYMYSISNTSYTYGNAITEVNQTPSTAYGSYSSVSGYMPNARTLTQRGGATHTLGLMGTAGVEWFVASQISLGFEVDLLAAYSFTGQKHSEYEGYNTATEGVSTYTDTTSPSSREFFMKTGCFGSNLTVNFYF